MKRCPPCVTLATTISILLTVSQRCVYSTTTSLPTRPNIVLFYADDFGYGDLSVYGHPTQEWGAIDRLAAEGVRFTQWYAPDHLCTPSRASLLTGRHPVRYGMYGIPRVQIPCHSRGLPHSEVTLAEVMQEAGYTTGMVGKWHLGTNSATYKDGFYLPHHHGFDYVGHLLPHSLMEQCAHQNGEKPKTNNCFLYKNDTIVQQPINLDNLTFTLVQDAKAFIYEAEEKPFFFYFSLPHMHTPMFNNPTFKNSSIRGAYGSMLNEMAWAVGEVVDTVTELGLQQRTLVLFVSDHGPGTEVCLYGGDTGPFRGKKSTMWEGAYRVPAVAWWPGTIRAGQVSSTLLNTMDLYPSLAALAGGQVPTDRKLDGHPALAAILGHSQQSPYSDKPMYFYCGAVLAAARFGDFKVYLRKIPEFSEAEAVAMCPDGLPAVNSEVVLHSRDACDRSELLDPPWVYNVVRDPKERFPLDVTTRTVRFMLKELAIHIANHISSIDYRGERLLDISKCAPSIIPCCNPPYCFCNFPH